MESLKFKTNIKCGGCVAKVTPGLNETAGVDQWEVDINNPEKILTVNSDGNGDQIISAVKDAGFVIEKID
ncbi:MULTISPECIES: heavy-metal-associated domain-containing protein [Dyadobacter]|jgi:copper chaperone|uniref:Heavy-metal-associated domain-containing protein n=1 Tax=Dyadobacter luticola TaxID=1979387 RepID=A0A5R9KMB1_9BACT|nr:MULTISPECIES: heavy-metal-associated domain-containing protein [Dyadobacter]TLU97345.1 heavy-metal-associated domain-containing protein [Dyadobacter luticola]